MSATRPPAGSEPDRQGHVPSGPAPRRATSTSLSLGVAFAAVCFVVAILAEVFGIDSNEGSMTDLATVLSGLPALSPWAWASLGAYAVVVTPVVGLVVTAWEYASVGDRRAMGLALAVLTVLGLSTAVSLLR